MMRYTFVLFVLLTVSAWAQPTFPEVLNIRVKNSDTAYGEQQLLRAATANEFDTLKALIYAGGDSAVDSADAVVYVQVKQGNRWSQLIAIDTGTATAGQTVIYDDDVWEPTQKYLLADTLKARWFYGVTLPSAVQTALLNRGQWYYRLVAVGKSSGNSVNLGGGKIRVERLNW